jgi:uncharacterized membrane protein
MKYPYLPTNNTNTLEKHVKYKLKIKYNIIFNAEKIHVNKERLYFIDIVRAFAILMMLQGHFVDTLLASTFRNLDSQTYSLWSFFRGVTAPTFFTISGLIFTFLLLKAKEKGIESSRMKKGIRRGFYLIGVGYFLRLNLLNLFSSRSNASFLAVDVLHCIGLSLIITVLLYFICRKNILIFSFLTLSIGILIFVLEPLYRSLSIEGIPIFIHNYISRNNGTVFRIIPWYGYSSIGAFIATLFYWNVHKKHFKISAVSLFVFFGLLLILGSSEILLQLSNITDVNVFKDAANYNYLFSKLGYVLLCFALFYGLEKFLKYPLLLTIGKSTLAIYIIHFILLYGSFIGIGFKNIGKVLSPIQVGIGAVLFLLLIVFLSLNYTRATAPLKQYAQQAYALIKNKR